MNAGKDTSDKENYFHRHLHFASMLLENYGGKEPFHLYLKNYFRQNKKHGSRDRKEIAALCYDYFRLGSSFKADLPLAKRILTAHFLLNNTPSDLLEKFDPQWNSQIQNSQEQKLFFLADALQIDQIFPFRGQVSPQIDIGTFNASFLIQPKTFIRVRPGNTHKVIQKLKNASVEYEWVEENSFAFENAVPLSDILKINKEAVIQDLNSQRTGELLKSRDENLKVWDCCAASGGKSIMAFDILNNPQLTVSDTRKGILKNLAIRFRQAGITNYKSIVADLSNYKLNDSDFDLIIADVPCSGSGTWARTPEQLQYFNEAQITEYAHLQRKITGNAVKSLKKNGHLLYITCSVFYAENEQNVEWLCENGLTLIEQKYFMGYDKRADTLFAALFKKEETDR